MIDFTETFFKEINNSKEVLYERLKQRENEPVQLTGRCAVIARKQKKHIDKLERLIRNAGMKPIILQSEDTKTFSKIEAKCQNLDILIFFVIHFVDLKEHIVIHLIIHLLHTYPINLKHYYFLHL